MKLGLYRHGDLLHTPSWWRNKAGPKAHPLPLYTWLGPQKDWLDIKALEKLPLCQVQVVEAADEQDLFLEDSSLVGIASRWYTRDEIKAFMLARFKN